MNFNKVPHSTEAEQSVLGSIILEPQLINLVSKRITKEHFYKEAHKTIYESMLSVHSQGQKIDIILLIEELKKDGYLEAVGGIGYITSLSTIVPTVSNIEYYLDMLIDKNSRRVSMSLLNSLSDKLLNEDLESLRNEAERLKSTLTNSKKVQDLVVDAADVKRRDTSNEFLGTGISKLNSLLGGGLAYSTFNILTGEPGSGKSTLLNQVIAKSIKDSHKCFLYSGELKNDKLMTWFKRTVANKEHIETKTNRNGDKYNDISNYCWDLISDWVRGKFKIYDKDAVATEKNLLSVIEHLTVYEGYRLFVLDNLMTIDIGNSEKQYQAQKQLCLSLKDLCDKYGIVVILVAHPKKVKEGTKPTMYDISGASEIVNLADNIFRLSRKTSMAGTEEINESKIAIQKNRWGGVIDRAITLTFDDYRKRFYQTENELNIDYGYDRNKKFEQIETDDLPF